jgi:hypothetical protein
VCVGYCGYVRTWFEIVLTQVGSVFKRRSVWIDTRTENWEPSSKSYKLEGSVTPIYPGALDKYEKVHRLYGKAILVPVFYGLIDN